MRRGWNRALQSPNQPACAGFRAGSHRGRAENRRFLPSDKLENNFSFSLAPPPHLE